MTLPECISPLSLSTHQEQGSPSNHSLLLCRREFESHKSLYERQKHFFPPWFQSNYIRITLPECIPPSFFQAYRSRSWGTAITRFCSAGGRYNLSKVTIFLAFNFLSLYEYKGLWLSMHAVFQHHTVSHSYNYIHRFPPGSCQGVTAFCCLPLSGSIGTAGDCS